MAKRHIPGGVNSPVRAFRNVDGEPFFVRRAKGCRLWDVDDRILIDYVGTWGPAILGHAPQVVVQAVQEAAKDGLSFGIPNMFEVEMARLICEWVPSADDEQWHGSDDECDPAGSGVYRARADCEICRVLSWSCRLIVSFGGIWGVDPRASGQCWGAGGAGGVDYGGAI